MHTSSTKPLRDAEPSFIEVIFEPELEPEAVEESEPIPEPISEPELAPSPPPASEPASEPEPKPKPKPKPEPEPEPELKPVTDPVSEQEIPTPQSSRSDIPPPPQLKDGKFVPEQQSKGGGKGSVGVEDALPPKALDAEALKEAPKGGVMFLLDEEPTDSPKIGQPKPSEPDDGLGEGTGLGTVDSEQVELTQNERDIILAQIIKYWRFNFASEAADDLTLNGTVFVLPDGMLASPFNGHEPWNPQKAMPQYDETVKIGNTFMSNLMSSFYTALRLAQPLELPPSTKGTWPRKISISFRFKDLPQRPF